MPDSDVITAKVVTFCDIANITKKCVIDTEIAENIFLFCLESDFPQSYSCWDWLFPLSLERRQCQTTWHCCEQDWDAWGKSYNNNMQYVGFFLSKDE